LAILRDLTNRDKHKLLQLVFQTVQTGDLGLVGDFPLDGRKFEATANAGEIKDDTEVFAFTFDRPM
ncbi:MAG TPA: hypothetical protein VKF63_03500, partial [Terracidiphilus sp.]|nr:hypothetical protein [Terracidiphilus sp.]